MDPLRLFRPSNFDQWFVELTYFDCINLPVEYKPKHELPPDNSVFKAHLYGFTNPLRH